MAAADTQNAPKPPPNLRMSGGEAKECGDCLHYASGHCKKFPPLCVSDEWVCDAWEKNPAGDADADEDAEPQENETGSMSEAKVRVREHMRRLRAKQS